MDDFSFGKLVGEGPNGEAMFNKGGALARFYARSVVIPFKSEQEGRPVHEQRDYVRILTPGERDEVDREVTAYDKKRWPEQWGAYQDGKEQEPDGTPLAHLFPGNPEVVENMRGLRFVTVEQLAEASDTAMASIGMGALDWRARAKRFLESSKDAGRFAKIEKAIEDQAFALRQKDEEIAALKAELASRDRKGAKAA